MVIACLYLSNVHISMYAFCLVFIIFAFFSFIAVVFDVLFVLSTKCYATRNQYETIENASVASILLLFFGWLMTISIRQSITLTFLIMFKIYWISFYQFFHFSISIFCNAYVWFTWHLYGRAKWHRMDFIILFGCRLSSFSFKKKLSVGGRVFYYHVVNFFSFFYHS